VALLEAVWAELSDRPDVGLEKVMTIVKPSISVPPLQADMKRLIEDTDVVITAIGD